jgi:glutathione S-transferase
MADPDKSIYDRASGNALKTVQAHSEPNDLKCFFSWFCPYVVSCPGRANVEVQRAWIALEEKKADYEYIEIQPYHKPKELLDVNPKGLVPVNPGILSKLI